MKNEKRVLNITIDKSSDAKVIPPIHFLNPLDYFNSHFSYTCDLVNQTIENVEGVEKVLGISSEEFASYIFFDIAHPDDRAIATEIVLSYHDHLIENNEISTMGPQMTLTYRMHCKDNSYKHIQHVITYSLVNSNGFGLKSFNIITDLSSLPFNRVTGRLKCACMKFSSDFSTYKSDVKKVEKSFFTNREKEILKLLYIGKSSQEISVLLCRSKHTIDKHRTNMLSKSGANNTRELIAYIIDSGVTPEELLHY